MSNIQQVIKNSLTSDQQAAALDTSQQVLTLACAGSGKSRTLAFRIARLLAEGSKPDEIVAFTFTEKAAESIKRRVAQALEACSIDVTVMGAMFIGTIHGYCQRILGDMDATYRQYDVLDENRLKLFLISRYPQLGLQSFRPRARGNSYFDTIKQVSDAWKTTNDELIDLQSIVAEDADLGNLLVQLDQRLQADQYIDFSLMIRRVVDGLASNNANAIKAVSKLKHLICDEYQDVNPCQERLIQLLHGRSETLFVVGDDDQSIYAWRGADVSNILTFQSRYPNSSTHTLSQNFRSTTPIVEASDRFVSAQLGPSRMGKNPVAASNRSPQAADVLWFDNRPNEATWVADRIEQLLGTRYEEPDGTVRGLTPADFAILMRSTRQEEQDGNPRHSAFTLELGNRGIPFSLEAGGGPFDRPEIAALRDTFELLRDSAVDRNTLQQHFNTSVLPNYPNASFQTLAAILTDWGRRIHRPQGSTRQRLYPQQLLYDLLNAFGIASTNMSNDVMREVGLFSQMILDVETVYMSVDSAYRFSEVLNFLGNAAESGYDVSTDHVMQRPDAVTVSTVHKMKGLEFPCVFVVDVEAQRFPKRRGSYQGWLPQGVMTAAINRGAYQSTHDEEARLFYTAVTRAERYLFVTGATNLPNGRRTNRPSPYSQVLAQHAAVGVDETVVPNGLAPCPQIPRIDDGDYPTNFSEVRYYLKCPKSYQFRERFGMNPAVPEMFGYGQTVHTAIQKLHEKFPDVAPSAAEAQQIASDTFHLKHVPPSSDPVNRPGGYERARDAAAGIAQQYVQTFGNDFQRSRQIEAVFEIPANQCVISGAIDLLLREDEDDNIVAAEIIDFKAMEGGGDPEHNSDLDWTELALQVQLYARAAAQVLGENAKTGSVHLLKDNQRVEVPITDEALDAAVENIEWAVQGIMAGDFPMRPHAKKCEDCDFSPVCAQQAEPFVHQLTVPPRLHLPGGAKETARSFSQFSR